MIHMQGVVLAFVDSMAAIRVACVRVVALAKTCPRAPAAVDATSTVAWGQAALPYFRRRTSGARKTHPPLSQRTE